MKLYYFQGRYRGETIRLAFELAGAAYEDIYLISHEQWVSLPLTYKQAPALQLESGQVITQSKAILGFIGRKFGLLPLDIEDAARVEELVEAAADVDTEIGKAFTTDQAKRDEVIKALPGVLDRWLSVWERIVKDKNVFVTDKHTLADAAIFRSLEDLIDLVPHALDSYPELSRFRQVTANLKAINDYMSSSRRNTMPKSAEDVSKLFALWLPVIRGP